MKFIKLYENYIISNLDQLRIDLNICDVYENDEYYIIYLKYFGLGRIEFLDDILRGKTIKFHCEYHTGDYPTIYTRHKYEEIIVKYVNKKSNLIIFVDTKNNEHLVNKDDRILISKINIDLDKYNL